MPIIIKRFQNRQGNYVIKISPDCHKRSFASMVTEYKWFNLNSIWIGANESLKRDVNVLKVLYLLFQKAIPVFVHVTLY